MFLQDRPLARLGSRTCDAVSATRAQAACRSLAALDSGNERVRLKQHWRQNVVALGIPG